MCEFTFCIGSRALLALGLSADLQLKPARVLLVKQRANVEHRQSLWVHVGGIRHNCWSSTHMEEAGSPWRAAFWLDYYVAAAVDLILLVINAPGIFFLNLFLSTTLVHRNLFINTCWWIRDEKYGCLCLIGETRIGIKLPDDTTPVNLTIALYVYVLRWRRRTILRFHVSGN